MFGKIENSMITQYPTSEAELRLMYSDVILPVNLLGCEYLITRGWVKVQTSEMPLYDHNMQYIIEGTPDIIANVWTQTWIILDYDINIITQRCNELYNSLLEQTRQLCVQKINDQTQGYTATQIAAWPQLQLDILTFNSLGTVGTQMQRTLIQSNITAQQLSDIVTPKIIFEEECFLRRNNLFIQIRATDSILDIYLKYSTLLNIDCTVGWPT